MGLLTGLAEFSDAFLLLKIDEWSCCWVQFLGAGMMYWLAQFARPFS